MTYVAMAIGAFYVFAGFVVMRAMAMDRLMDQVLAALNSPTDAKEALRSKVLSAGAFLTLASGLALAVLSALALPLFVANVAVQGGYLLWAESALKPDGADEARGRRQTKNAFVIYCAAAAFVVWLAVQGGLRPWSAGIEALALDALIVIGGVAGAWAFIHMPTRRSASAVADETGEAPIAYEPAVRPTRLRLAPEYMCRPLWDDDTGDTVNVFDLGLPDDLMYRIEEWDDRFQATYNADDPAASDFATPGERAAYVEEGRKIAVALRAAWPGELTVAEEFS